MPSRMSLFNPKFNLQIARSVGWVSIIYFLGLAFALPLRMLMTYSNELTRVNLKVDNLFHIDLPIQLALTASVPILISVFLFRFLHVKAAADLMHSLPIKRERLFFHYTIAGVVLLLVPVIAIALIVLIIHSAFGFGIYFSTEDILYWASTTIVFDIVLFAAGVFVAMLTGLTAVHAVLTYIFVLFPAGITLLVLFNLKVLLYGFPRDHYMNLNIDKMTPISYVAMLERHTLHWEGTVIYLLIAAVLYGFSLFIYKKRKVEAVSQAIAFSSLKSIFKYGATFCTMLLGGMYFGNVQGQLAWTIFGYVLGAIIGYFAAEMVLEKTWRVFNKFKGLALYAAGILMIVVVAQLLEPYEDRVPSMDKVKSVLFTDMPIGYVYEYKSQTPEPLTGKESLQDVQELHSQIVADKKENVTDQSRFYENVFFIYELDNSKKMIRQYQIEKNKYKRYLKPIYESAEYKRSTRDIFDFKTEDVNKITITSNGPENQSVNIVEEKDLKEAVELLKDEVLHESYDEMNQSNGISSRVEIFIARDRIIHVDFKYSYDKFEQWLEEKGKLDEARVSADDIEHILIASYEDVRSPEHRGSARDVVSELEGQPGSLKITDKKRIDYCLENVGWGDSDQKYGVLIYFKGIEYPQVGWFDKDNAPDFVINHFK
ncbi:DUF6449 domain-containing protein [Bacillus sp. T33-2]|uniref:DUF6449 domain-containing protein n=1 Tax=Bacillus sp. T33-2 TaxID=2054168 RepID=UPI000C75DE0C|nr:DUF6449 domain-containing protein [Bacillus sp. T33-2]PLR94155.1 multidrug ABC transporter permease [Bacillus sp. T33-2]